MAAKAASATMASAAASAQPTATASETPVEPQPSGADESDAMRPAIATNDLSMDADFDLGSTFDVPAFLRRQEG
jgi:hypothetical protein